MPTPPRSSHLRRRDQRGAVLPSPVVMLSVIAVAMAAIAFVATRNAEPTEREVVTPVAQEPAASAEPTATPTKKPKPPPAVKRGEVFVEVYNNSGITGLAGGVAEQVGSAGWQVVGTDNWVGSIPTTTVYYPKRLQREADLLALDLGVKRTYRAVAPMKLDRLTLILTAPLA